MNQIIQMNEANCMSCYKCIRSCKLNAICLQNEQTDIIDSDCILCGDCVSACPQHTPFIESDLERVKAMMDGRLKVYASIAPSYIAAFPNVSFAQMSAALKKLGFAGVEETALGAAEVSKEYSRILSQKLQKNLITTCCPSVNLLIEKYYPELIEYMAPIVTPMTAHAKMMRDIYGRRIKIVFIGPCISKKYEAQQGKDIQAVLFFDELKKWLTESNLQLGKADPEASEIHTTLARLYPTPRGIIHTVARNARANYKSIAVDGLENCLQTLNELRDYPETEGYFLEMNACRFSCVGGPGLRKHAEPHLRTQTALLTLSQKKTRTPKPLTENRHPNLSTDFSPQKREFLLPTDEHLQPIFAEMGKLDGKNVLNCGACGYDSCKEKAVAVYQGKSDIRVCLPILQNRAESMSNLILDTTPNATFVLDNELKILHYNKAVQHLFFRASSDLRGIPIQSLIATEAFENPDVDMGKNGPTYVIYTDEENDVTVELCIVYARREKQYVVIAKDITRDVQAQQKMETIRNKTLEIAQRVIDKQMRAAQEIASLLGETTGETKAALTKLKSTIIAEEDSK